MISGLQGNLDNTSNGRLIHLNSQLLAKQGESSALQLQAVPLQAALDAANAAVTAKETDIAALKAQVPALQAAAQAAYGAVEAKQDELTGLQGRA